MVLRAHLTSRTAILLSKRGLQLGYQWILARGRECFHCRACDRQVNPFESICPHCGAANPATIAIAPIATICGLGLLVMGSWYYFI